MKKHIIGFTIFAFIVGSFVSIWALFGYFTQTIPNVPKVESDNLPVFASDKKTSCFPKRREKTSRQKISYEVVDSYYFADEKTIVSTLKVNWNGFGIAPKKLFISPKFFIGGKEVTNFGGGQSKSVTFGDLIRENNITVSFSKPFDKNELKDNIYADFDISSDSDAAFSSDKSVSPKQVIVVHGESSIIDQLKK